MAKRINLDRVKLVEVVAFGLILEVEEDDLGRVLVRVESTSGGQRIHIKQHEEDARCIVYELEKPKKASHLTLV